MAILLGLGWPALLVREEAGLVAFTLFGGLIAFAIGLVALGALWALRRPPRTRRAVIRIFVWTGAAIAIATPFVFADFVNAVGEYENDGAATGLSNGAALALLPLSILVGLPSALFAGAVFSLVALVKGEPIALAPPHERRLKRTQSEPNYEAQPFV